MKSYTPPIYMHTTGLAEPAAAVIREEYMSGRYDVACYGCKGKRVVLELDRDNIAAELLARIDSTLEDRARYEWERTAERRMGA